MRILAKEDLIEKCPNIFVWNGTELIDAANWLDDNCWWSCHLKVVTRSIASLMSQGSLLQHVSYCHSGWCVCLESRVSPPFFCTVYKHIISHSPVYVCGSVHVRPTSGLVRHRSLTGSASDSLWIAVGEVDLSVFSPLTYSNAVLPFLFSGAWHFPK